MSPIISPKYLSQNHHLTKAVVASASTFKLGSKAVRLNIAAERSAGLATRLALRPTVATRLGRSENEIEGASAPILDEGSQTQIRDFARSVNTGLNISENTSFFVVTVRRRNQPAPNAKVRIISNVAAAADRNAPQIMFIGRPAPIARTVNMVLGMDLSQSVPQFFVFPEGRRVVVKLLVGAISGIIGAAGSNNEDEQAESETNAEVYTDEKTQDFAECYSECLEDVPKWLLAVVGGVCTACTGILATAAGVSAGVVTLPAGVAIAAADILLICAPCAAAIGVILGNCLLQCHEMIGT